MTEVVTCYKQKQINHTPVKFKENAGSSLQLTSHDYSYNEEEVKNDICTQYSLLGEASPLPISGRSLRLLVLPELTTDWSLSLGVLGDALRLLLRRWLSRSFGWFLLLGF